MPQAERRAGFTLIEVALAIVIGMIVMGGAVFLFQQTRTSAQNAMAKEKLIALTIVVEEMDARNNGIPTLGALKEAWKAKRPDDYNTSPWGGTVPDTNFIVGDDVVGRGQEIGTSANGTPFASPSLPVEVDRGRLYYFRRDPNGTGRPYLWLPELSAFGPEDPNAVYRMTSYGVAYLGPQAEQWFFVEGREKTNAAGAGRLNAQGQIQD